MSNHLRITGLASGLDVDTTVKQMMKSHVIRVDKLKQDRQIMQWRQELYRDLIGNLNTFKSTYFDVLKPEKYMLSKRNFSNFTVSNSSTSPSVNITTTSGAVAGNYKVAVNSLAESAKIIGTTCINVEEALSTIKFPAQITDANKVISLDIGDGKAYNVTLDTGNFYLPDLVSRINSKLTTTDNGDISSKVKAVLSNDGTSVNFVGIKEIDDANKSLTINVSGKDYTLTLDKGNFTYQELAYQINSKLKSIGIDTKLKSEMSASGNNVNFVDLTGGLESIKINNLDIAAQEVDNIYSMTLNLTNPNESQENILAYSKNIIQGFNDSLSIKIDGNQYNITIPPTNDIGNTVLIDELVQTINNSLSASGINSNDLSLNLSFDKTKLQFVSNTNKSITIAGNANKTLGFADSFEVSQSVNDKMSNLFNDKVTFTINNGTSDVVFRYDFNSAVDYKDGSGNVFIGGKSKTISQFFDDISSKANVKLSYSELTRKFSIESNATGASQSISISGGDGTTNSFLSKLFGGDNLSDTGADAKVSITNSNGETSNVTKSTNNFVIDGVNYSLVKADGIENTVTLTTNTEGTFDKIKEFIEKYNETIEKISQKINEKKQYKFLPLTDEQRDAMSEDEMKKWESKAKEGILSNDNTLENMLLKMRRAFFDPVPGVGISLKDIGLSTSRDISQGGKIIIDEVKLKDALKNNGDKVTQLLTKTSSISYNPGENNTARYSEEGIFQRLDDILQDNLRIVRDSKGKKGILLDKAGIKGDYSEFHNTLTDQLIKKDKIISEMEKKLATKENKYYLQFSQLEKAMQQMNSQSSWLAQQLGMGGR